MEGPLFPRPGTQRERKLSKTMFLPSRNFLFGGKTVAFACKIKSCSKEANGLQSVAMMGRSSQGKLSGCPFLWKPFFSIQLQSATHWLRAIMGTCVICTLFVSENKVKITMHFHRHEKACFYPEYPNSRCFGERIPLNEPL